jgi:hypothetical protein
MKAFQDRTLTEAAGGLFPWLGRFFAGLSQPPTSLQKKKSPGIAGAFLTIDHFAFS